MKKTALYFMFLSLIISCKNEVSTENPEMLKLQSEQLEMKNEVLRKDSTINSFMQSLNDIESNLDEIKQKQKIVAINSKDVELQKTQPERIVEDISFINELLEKNRKTIASLSSKLKKSNLKVAEFEKMIERLTKQIEEKDAEIVSLKDELERKNNALKTLFSEYNDRIQDLDSQGKVINTAFYAFGTKKELREKGVTTKEGGFIGMGRTSKVSSDLNKSYFTKIDISEVTEIKLSAKKIHILTTHPSSSYKVDGVNAADRLVILNPTDFWSVSKYLVIEIE